MTLLSDLGRDCLTKIHWPPTLRQNIMALDIINLVSCNLNVRHSRPKVSFLYDQSILVQPPRLRKNRIALVITILSLVIYATYSVTSAMTSASS
jgi:hypothetical protein